MNYFLSFLWRGNGPLISSSFFKRKTKLLFSWLCWVRPVSLLIRIYGGGGGGHFNGQQLITHFYHSNRQKVYDSSSFVFLFLFFFNFFFIYIYLWLTVTAGRAAGFISSSQLWYLFSLLDDVRWLYTSTYLCNNRLGLAVCVRLDTSQRIFVPDFFFFHPTLWWLYQGEDFIFFSFFFFLLLLSWLLWYPSTCTYAARKEENSIWGGRIVSKTYAAIHPSIVVVRWW